jgi:hypothetical protein
VATDEPPVARIRGYRKEEVFTWDHITSGIIFERAVCPAQQHSVIGTHGVNKKVGTRNSFHYHGNDSRCSFHCLISAGVQCKTSLSSVCQVECWELSNVSANTAVAIIKCEYSLNIQRNSHPKAAVSMRRISLRM